ncbi:class I SAM-dependent methyltransferase [Nocardioides alcanivorans]|uniref:class I SAM-dependent methyltransferase n=1 Tax=Nocardioides alcanivorans TaxID=2897352 RepID=UPI001F158825|nr:class I SAM-dependent methyltransferase [Nocardioides alcanivorans]
MASDNTEGQKTWTDRACAWVANDELFDHLFAPVTAAVLAAADIRDGESVLDVGCGSGTLLEAAVAKGASATGVDISGPMVEAARIRVPTASATEADAQTADLLALPGALFDVVMSRFGVMFFADPITAFANLRAAAPDGRLAFACWRSRDENPMFSQGIDLLNAELVAPPAPTPPGEPGPTSLSDPDRLDDVLSRAGWRNVDLQPLDFVCDYGSLHGTDGVEERLSIILSTGGRDAREELEPRLGPAGWQSLLDRVRGTLRPASGSLTHPAAVWLVTAD